ncbi:MAG: hypothetical protein K1X91_10190 [Bacteriodetes bacterium]|nr:hypothetical protein [Bacteroidota bacterium]
MDNWENILLSFKEHYREYYLNNKEVLIDNQTKDWSKNFTIVQQTFQKYLSVFSAINLPLASNQCITTIGDFGTNGHAFFYNSSAYPFYCVEHYATTMYADVFVLHELLHAYHYTIQPEYYFHNQTEQSLLSRNLLCEGVATFCSSIITTLPTQQILWADVYTNAQYNNWLQQCHVSKKDMCRFCLDNFHHALTNELFYYADGSPLYNRGGYWLGMNIVQDLYQVVVQPSRCCSIPQKVMQNTTHFNGYKRKLNETYPCVKQSFPHPVHCQPCTK